MVGKVRWWKTSVFVPIFEGYLIIARNKVFAVEVVRHIVGLDDETVGPNFL